MLHKNEKKDIETGETESETKSEELKFRLETPGSTKEPKTVGRSLKMLKVLRKYESVNKL